MPSSASYVPTRPIIKISLIWDSVNWSYIPGNDPTGVALGSGGYWGTIGGICNWPAAVASQTRDRPPWSRRRNLLRSQK